MKLLKLFSTLRHIISYQHTRLLISILILLFAFALTDNCLRQIL
jgi:hypothetical protein